MGHMGGTAADINERSKNNKPVRWALYIITVVLTLIIFYFLFSLVDVKKVLDTLASISPFYVSVLLILEAATILLMARRFQVILGHMGSRLPYLRCLSVNMATYPVIPVTPSISGNFIKVFYLRKESPSPIVAGTVVAERLFDMSALIGLVFLGLAFNFNLLLLLIVVAAAVAAMLFILAINLVRDKFSGKISRTLDEAAQIIIGLVKNPAALAAIALNSLAIWALALIQIYIFFLAVGASVPLPSVIANMPVAMLIGQIPVTIGGMGTRDGAMMQLFSGAASYEQILAAGVLFSIFRYWLPAGAGVLFMLYENSTALKNNKVGL